MLSVWFVWIWDQQQAHHDQSHCQISLDDKSLQMWPLPDDLRIRNNLILPQKCSSQCQWNSLHVSLLLQGFREHASDDSAQENPLQWNSTEGTEWGCEEDISVEVKLHEVCSTEEGSFHVHKNYKEKRLRSENCWY